jgi:hypothetical protein
LVPARHHCGVDSSGAESSMAALALALAEQPSPRSASSWRIVLVLPLTVVVTSALAVASDLQSPFRLLVELEELLDEDDAFADVDTDVLSADAMRMSVLMIIKPPIAPAAAIAKNGQRLDCNLRIAETPFCTNERAPTGRRQMPAARRAVFSRPRARP